MSVAIRSLIKEIHEKAGGLIYRNACLVRAKEEDGSESAERYEISFSSEEPYLRYFGLEILGHKKTEVDMGWINSGNAPWLKDHDRTKLIGIIDSAKLKDGRATAVVRFGKSSIALDTRLDVDAGTRPNISVGYEVEDMELIKEAKGGEPATYRVTKWKPLEVSSVALPADTTVGVNRSKEDVTGKPNPQNSPKENPMTDEELKALKAKERKEAQKDALDAERERVKKIRSLCETYKVPELASKHIEDGTEPEAVQKSILDAVFEKSKSQGPAQGGPGVHTGHQLGGLSKFDKRTLAQFSFLRALANLSNGIRMDGVEAEMHQQACADFKAIGRAVGGFGVPLVVLRATLDVDTDGTNLVGNRVMPSFLDVLHKRMILDQLGATVLTGLDSDVTFPKGTQAVAGWLGTGDTAAGTAASTSKLSLTPKRIGVTQSLDKKLLIQSSPDVEAWLRNNLATAIALGVDLAGLFGTGADDQPTGVAYTAGIGSVAGGTNGAAPTWANIVGLESLVAAGNADIGRLGYATNTAVRGKLKTTAKVSSTDSVMIWNDGPTPLNGHRVGVSNQIPATLTKGSSSLCSGIFFGNWADLIIGMFGGLDMTVDPYTRAKQAEIVLTLNAYGDVGVCNAVSFSAMLDALTA